MAKTITAYGVYTYSGTPAGMTGRIIDNGGTSVSASPNMNTLGPDPQVEGFINPGSAPLICSTERVASGTPDNAIFDIEGSLVASPSWSNIDNLYGLVTVGNYLYALDYDSAKIVEINPGTYTETGVSYTYATPHSGYTARGQAILNIGGTLFGLFSVPKNDWSDYQPSVLIKFSITGGSSISVNEVNDTGVAENAFAMAVSGNYLYIVAIGGIQSAGSYNPNSKIQYIDHTSNLSSVSTIMTASSSFPYEFRDISFDGSTAYILAGAYNSSWNLEGKLVSTMDFSTLTTINDFTGGASGYYWAAQYISDNDRVFFARGNEILVYDASANSVDKTLDMSSLGASYTDLNAMSYAGVDTTTSKTLAAPSIPRSIRGYRSPLQASATRRGVLARQLANGRPELTGDELKQLESQLSGA